MNKVFFSGNIARDIELKTTPSGKTWGHTSIAVKRPFSKDKDAVDFFKLTVWEKNAEFMKKWTPKGTRILVEGRLQTSKYKDKDGNERTGTDIIVEQVEFAGGKKDSDSKTKDDFDGEPVSDDDTPF